jgi:hypothetical protein
MQLKLNCLTKGKKKKNFDQAYFYTKTLKFWEMVFIPVQNQAIFRNALYKYPFPSPFLHLIFDSTYSDVTLLYNALKYQSKPKTEYNSLATKSKDRRERG